MYPLHAAKTCQVLQLDDSLSVPVRISRRARYMRLVASISGVEVVVPAGASNETIRNFVISKRDWIVKMARHYSKVKERSGHEDGNIYYLGCKYRYHIVKDRLPSVVVSDALKQITFHVPDKRRYKKTIEQWYRKQATRIILQRLPQISARTGFSYNKVSIKNQRSRWGSCSTKKNLNFNLLLAAAPVDIIDYVIIHELVHTVELNHSKRFWQLVQCADPDYKQHKSWLDDHAPTIGIEGL